MKSTPVQELHQIRNDLFEFAKIVKELPPSREMSLAHTALQESMMFTGNTIKELNHGVSPYENSENPFNTTIDPFHVDKDVKPVVIPTEWKDWDHVQKVKWLRMMLELTTTKFRIINSESITGWAVAIIVTAQMHTISAKGWLGMELGRLRDQS